MLPLDADKITGLFAAEGSSKHPTAVLRETWALLWARTASRSTLSSPPVSAQESSSTGWPNATHLTGGHQLTWEYARQVDGRTDVESTDIVHGFSAHHLVCWGWGGLKKLHTAANNTPPTG
ncbi:hypothetical protein ACFUNF_04490 [Streptomyces sp. NPDC057291]|uniref:hypothetical protein n=1 Tax=Streptomyces sp. NPDC057291 TaxID=3346087 RepID=UPI003643D67E